MKSESPQYYQFSRPNIQRLVRPAARRVLDVGCAAGAMGAALKAARPGLRVDGIEVVAEAAHQARAHLDQVLCGPVEAVADQLPDGAYDVVVLADVLEHTLDPAAVLARLRPKLAAGGELLLSLPNVRHWSVLRQILEGRFDYTDLGILDRTHLRFFTCLTLLQLLLHAGFTVVHLERVETAERVPDALLPALAACGLEVQTLAWESAAYQYLLLCRVAPLAAPLAGDSGLRAGLVAARDAARAGEILPCLQHLALLQEAVTPNTMAPALCASFTRVFQFAAERLLRTLDRGPAGAEVADAAGALAALAQAVGV